MTSPSHRAEPTASEPLSNLTALVAALIEALAVHEAAQRIPSTPAPEPRASDSEPALISVVEAAKRLGISRSSAYRWADAGELPTRRLGGRVYVVASQLNDFVNGEVA